MSDSTSHDDHGHDGGRRRFLTRALAVGGTALLAGCDRLSQSDTMESIFDATSALSQKAHRLIASRQSMAREYPASEIAPTFRANGTTSPTSSAYRILADYDFLGWTLKVDGLVEAPQSFSLDELKALPSRTQITRQDCVEGWSCIGQWKGVVLADVLDRVRPSDNARFVVFHCADNVYGGPDRYYESLDLIEANHPQTLLAYELNGEALPVANGAPLRLRAERQLGYKMAKYIMRIELVEDFRHLGRGNGGYWEDRGYSWWAGI